MSYEFDANNEILNLGSAAVTAAPFTMSLWYYPYTVGTVQRRLGVVGASDSDHWNLLVETDDTLIWRARDDGTNSDAASAGTVVDNQWNHCCGVENSDTSRTVWLNGVKNNVGSSSRTPDASNETSIGNRKWVGSESPAQGRIAHFAIWNVALNDEEIACLAAGVAPSEIRPGSLVVYESLLTGPGSFTVSNAVLNSGDGPSVYESPAVLSVEWVAAHLASGSSNITVPTGATAALVLDVAYGYQSAQEDIVSCSIGGQACSLIYSDAPTDGDHPCPTAWGLISLPSPGTQSFAWTRRDGDANWGGEVAIIFLTGADISSGATGFTRDVAYGFQSAGPGDASATVDTASGDLVLSLSSLYGIGTPEHDPALLLEAGTYYEGRSHAASVLTADAATETISITQQDYPTVLSASVKPAATSQRGPNIRLVNTARMGV